MLQQIKFVRHKNSGADHQHNAYHKVILKLNNGNIVAYPISLAITTKPNADVKTDTSTCTSCVEKTITETTIAIRILILTIKKAALKSGAAIKKALNRILVRKKANKN